jgi:pSer/pThr/pTyr-binding forkhead associated (FHA) protein
VASLELPDGDERRLEGKTVRLGRDPANDLAFLGDPKISRSHAELRDRDGQWILVDLGSSNGTKVNDRRIEQHPLRDGDRIQLGRTTILFTAEEDPNPTETDVRALAKAPNLSERERHILALVARGFTDRQIGERLFISPSTVRSHLDRIGKKTGLRRRAELTRLAIDLGVLA